MEGFLEGFLEEVTSMTCPHWCAGDHEIGYYHASEPVSVSIGPYRLDGPGRLEGPYCLDGPERLDVQTAQYLPDDPDQPPWSPTVEIAVHAGGRYRLIGLTPAQARELAGMLLAAAQRVRA